MAYIFCIANQKGGVGKTTTAVNTAAALAKKRKKVLLVDLDAQGNATTGSGVEKSECEFTIYDLLVNKKIKFDQVVQKSEVGGYDVLPSNRELSAAELEIAEMKDRDNLLKNILAKDEDRYDFILIDCPPSLSLITVNALCCAMGVIVPMQCEYYAMEGLSDLVETINRVVANKNPNLKVIGVLRVMYSPRISLQNLVSNELIQTFGAVVFDTVIPRNVSLAEAPSFGKPVMYYKKTSTGAKAYLDFGRELIRRVKDEVQAAQKE